MTVDLAQLKEHIATAKFKEDHLSMEWPYQRGWNGALQFVSEQIAKMEREINNGQQ